MQTIYANGPMLKDLTTWTGPYIEEQPALVARDPQAITHQAMGTTYIWKQAVL